MISETPMPASVSAVPHCGIDLGSARDRLLRHEIYGLVTTGPRLRRFMESHVFAVWDFQSLLKAMQQRLTCTTVPWIPTADCEARRLVNEIVLEEESDELPDGGFASHFELYLDSMSRAGADTSAMEYLLHQLADGAAIDDVLEAGCVPREAAAFVRESFAMIGECPIHGLVAAFTYGREDVIPEMFRSLVATLASREPSWSRLHWYLERHIEADDEKHGPMCRRILRRLCGDDPVKWSEASFAARRAIDARVALWDALAAELARIPS